MREGGRKGQRNGKMVGWKVRGGWRGVALREGDISKGSDVGVWKYNIIVVRGG